MSWLAELARPEIRALRPYEHATWEPGLVRLHANELPWRAHGDASSAGLNCYPEPHPYALIEALANFYGVAPDAVLAGRGSDEVIDLLVRAYCRAGQDAVLICPPTFGMYAVTARIQGARVLEVPLQPQRGWALDAGALDEALRGPAARAVKLIFLCSPNNPTGNRLDSEAIITLSRELEGRALVVVDEAYVEFARAPSLLAQLPANPGLVLLRTLSKAHGMAGARCGVAIAHAEVIALLRRIIQPYAIAQPSIEAVFRALQPQALARTRERIGALAAEREHMSAALRQLPNVTRVWDSDANFLLVQFADAAAAIARAHGAGMLLRDLRGVGALGQAVRISLGTPEQNERLLACLQ